MTMTEPAPIFTPEEMRGIVASLHADLARFSPETGAGATKGRQSVVGWLAGALRAYGRSSRLYAVALYLAVIKPEDQDVKLRRIVKGAHVSEIEVEKALNRLLADGFIDIRPTARIGAKRIRLIR